MFEKSKKTKIQKVEKSKSRTLFFSRKVSPERSKSQKVKTFFDFLAFCEKNHPKSRKKTKVENFLTS